MHKPALWHSILVHIKKNFQTIFLIGFWCWALYGWANPIEATGSAKIIISILNGASALLIIWCIITAFIRMDVFSGRDWSSLGISIFKLFITFNIAARFVANIEQGVNNSIESLIEEPAIFYATVTALLITRWLYLTFARVPAPDKTTSKYEYGMPSILAKPSQASLKLTSVHECGHALVYALLMNKPSIMRMALTREFANGVANLGYMESSIELDGRATRDQLYWRMLVSLGGTAAELAVYGKEYEGALQDMRSWQFSAERYLQNGFGDVLVADDGKDVSIRHNIDAFNRLYAEQKDIVHRLMSDNVTLLGEMADELRRVGTLNTERICTYLERVVIPDSVPVFE